MFEQQLAKKYAFIDSLKRELTKITNDGDMLNYLYLSKGNSIAYFSDGNDSKKTGNVATAIALVELIATQTGDYTNVRHFYEEELRQAEGNMTYSNIISRPYIADKKAYPVRWVIVAVCGIGALLMSILVVAAIEKIDTKE